MKGIMFLIGMMLLFLLLVPVIVFVLPLIGIKGFIFTCSLLVVGLSLEGMVKMIRFSK